jgi:sugar/nucleoside kinase (ribokinase family)
MLRFAPLGEDDEDWGRGRPSARAKTLFSIGGDELNVAVCLQRIGGWKCHHATILPDTILGKVVSDCAQDANVNLHAVIDKSKSSQIGVFYVIPKERRVQYQRRRSSFWTLPHRFDWNNIITNITKTTKKKSSFLWIHQTGITPLCGPHALQNWKGLMRSCVELDVPVSLDLNHRPALGTFSKLWNIVRLELSCVRFLVLSRASLCNLGRYLGLKALVRSAETSPFEIEENFIKWIDLMRRVHGILNGPILCVCFKTRDENHLQTRWSAAIDGCNTYTSNSSPVLHVPKDECGGGSAWSAGLIDRLTETRVRWWKRDSDSAWCVDEQSMVSALRRADLSAALCQEERGDHSVVSRLDIERNERLFKGQIADVRQSPPLQRQQQIISGIRSRL